MIFAWYTWGTSVLSLTQRACLESAQNLTWEKSQDGAKQTIGVNGHPSVWQPCLVVLNLSFESKHSHSAPPILSVVRRGLICMKRLPPWSPGMIPFMQSSFVIFSMFCLIQEPQFFTLVLCWIPVNVLKWCTRLFVPLLSFARLIEQNNDSLCPPSPLKGKKNCMII